MTGGLKYVHEELAWFNSLPHRHKIIIAGNHDWAFQHFLSEGHENLAEDICQPAYYLRDNGVEIEGLKFWGSPWQPWFCDWAFNLRRGPEIRAKWDLIPEGVDVLVTHGPPMGILDRVGNSHVGCADLAVAVARLAPKIHVFGHIHSGYGQESNRRTRFYNASVVNEAYRLANEPWSVEL